MTIRTKESRTERTEETERKHRRSDIPTLHNQSVCRNV